MVDGIIFDLDGTLWDSTPEILNCWKQLLPDLTLPELKSCMGETTVDIANILGMQKKNVLKLQDEEVHWLSEHPVPPYIGVTTLVQFLNTENIPCFIVSNCQARYIECFLYKSGLEQYFKDWISFGDNGQDKSQNIKLIMERNNLQSPIYVGDTDLDMIAARDNNIKFAFAAYGFNKDVKECDAILTDPLDLVAYLRKI